MAVAYTVLVYVFMPVCDLTILGISTPTRIICMMCAARYNERPG